MHDPQDQQSGKKYFPASLFMAFIASVGHASSHFPHPLHRSASTFRTRNNAKFSNSQEYSPNGQINWQNGLKTTKLARIMSGINNSVNSARS